MTDISRLIEHAFPLKQASLDSVHEKNVRHGHISTLHIWPARRPLAACRAALIATLLPDPRRRRRSARSCARRSAARWSRGSRSKKMPNGQIVERDEGGDRGRHPALGPGDRERRDLDWFRAGDPQGLRRARAPKVLDPFAGGGAIPLEAMRLGCEATAIDINPVAWFILKCTLEYPQKLAGQTRPLPDFILARPTSSWRTSSRPRASAGAARGRLKARHDRPAARATPHGTLQAGLPVRGAVPRGRPRLARARLGPVGAGRAPDASWPTSTRPMPTSSRWRSTGKCLRARSRCGWCRLKDDGTPDIDALNAEFTRGLPGGQSATRAGSPSRPWPTSGRGR